MHDRNIFKVKIADTSYYLHNAKYYFNQWDTWRCVLYLTSVKKYIEDTIKSFKKF